MKKVVLGKIIETGKDFTLDIEVLIKSRLLTMASSGGGKSYLIRKLLEQTHGQVQQIVLDVEDDFSSLREKYDYILIGKGGDVSASVRTAAMLAHKLLELGADAIINLYELKQFERIQFVKTFLEAMINAPKELWHPVLLIQDECQMFAPEKSKAESLGAVIDAGARGRKRGFCLIPATQRLSKLHKDVAAECQNKIIGLANMDIDRKRAAEELGFSERAAILALRDLEPGEFYAVGPAFPKGVNKIKISEVRTTHHEAGKIFKKRGTLAASSKMKSILAKLDDLPKEAEEELTTVKGLKEKIRSLEALSTMRKIQANSTYGNSGPIPKTKEVIKYVIKKKDIEQSLKKFKTKLLHEIAGVLTKKFTEEDIESARAEISHYKSTNSITTHLPIRVAPVAKKAPVNIESLRKGKKEIYRDSDSVVYADSSELGKDVKLGRCERLILKFLAMREGKDYNRSQIGAMTEYSSNGGSFNNAVSKLHALKLIEKVGDKLRIASSQMSHVINLLGDDYLKPEMSSLEGWKNKLGKCPKTIFEALHARQGPVSKEELGSMTGYEPNGGSFNNAISKLNMLGLIQRNGDGTLEFNQEVLNL